MNKKRLLQGPVVALGSLMFSTAAMAVDDLHAVLTGALTYSGDDWRVAQSANGSPVTFRGGGRIKLGAGVLYTPTAYPFAASLVANYHFDNAAGANGSGEFRRAPLDGMVYYTGMERLRIGVGLSYIFAPRVELTVDGQEQSVKYKNAFGQAFEIGYALTPQLWTNLRLSAEKYKPKSSGTAETADLNHLSVNVSYVF
jgi:hypothetical protein